MTTSTRFALNVEAAREWIAGLVLPDDSDEHDHETPTLPETWDPTKADECSRADALVSAAQYGYDGAVAVITAPSGCEVFFDSSATEDRDLYRWLVDIPVPGATPAYPDLRLASSVEVMRRLVGDGARGAEAALAVLNEAVGQANVLLARLEAYCSHVAATSAAASAPTA